MKSIVLFSLIPIIVFAQTHQDILTVQDIFGSSKFPSKSIEGFRWIDGGNKFSYQELDTTTQATNIWIYTISNGKRELCVDGSTLKLQDSNVVLEYNTYEWSPDEKNILFVSEPPQAQYYSHITPDGNYFLYNLSRKTMRRLTYVDIPQYNHKFSPDGSTLGFVRSNNLMVLNLKTGKERQLTHDGTEHIVNGKFDWVYEEEFEITDGWQWSPDGKKIAFWRLDENRVPEFHMINFMTSDCEVLPMRYPKPGDKNSLVRIGVVSVESGSTVWMDLGARDDIYIPRIQWTSKGNQLVVQKLNRLQDTLQLVLANPSDGMTSVFFTEVERTWIEEGYELQVLKTQDAFFLKSERDGFAHLYLFTMHGELISQITKGNWDVCDIIGINENKKTIYFTATALTPLEKQFYSVRYDGSQMNQLTENGYSHHPLLSPNDKYFLDTYSNISTPPKIALTKTNGEKIRLFEDNAIAALQCFPMGSDTFFTVKTGENIALHAWMLKPPSFNPLKKYPVLIHVYGGPNSQTVVNHWGGSTYLWFQAMAEKGFIIVSADGRGTGQRGKEFKSAVYHHLGKLEVNDQIEFARYLAKQPFIDSSRIGIWGWSYGGYMSILAILKGTGIFKTAVAVAPVTDWRLYDDIYTERYMGLPADNKIGYDESSTLTYADLLQGSLLILHGTTDDNVHMQNTMQLGEALKNAGKHFETLFYVNKNHGIYGGNTRLHLFETITNYLLDHL